MSFLKPFKPILCIWVKRPDYAPMYAGQYDTSCGVIEELYDCDWSYCPYCSESLVLRNEE